LVPLRRVIEEAAMFKVVEEGSAPVILFNAIRGNRVDFTLLWDKL
jgi:hypothetical protein